MFDNNNDLNKTNADMDNQLPQPGGPQAAPPQSPWRQVAPSPYRPYETAPAGNSIPAVPAADAPPVAYGNPNNHSGPSPQGGVPPREDSRDIHHLVEDLSPATGAQDSTPNANAATAAQDKEHDNGRPAQGGGPATGAQPPAGFPPAPAQQPAPGFTPYMGAPGPAAQQNPGGAHGPVLRIDAPYPGAAAGFHQPNPAGSAGTTASAGPAAYSEYAAASASAGSPGGPGGGNTKKGKGRGKGFVAAMLALSLITGSAGGGATYFLLREYDGAQAAEVSANADTPAAQTNVTNLQTSDITQVVDKAAASVVEISCEVRMSGFFTGYAAESSGSGVIVSEDGYIVTNDHVVEGASAITVRTSDGEEYEATLIGTDSKTDIAVLKVEAAGLQAASFADSDQIVVGQLAVAIGNPLGTLGGTVTDGIISGLDREITIGNETMTLIQTSAAVNPGNSGGGLFDANGDLVGIVNSKSYGVEVEGLGFAIPSNTVAEVVEDLLANGYVTGRPQLGIQIVDILDQQSMVYYGVSEPGVYIDQVNREIGLQPGDRIVQVDGVEIESGSQLKNMVSEREVGDVMEFVVERDGRQTRVSVELAEQVPDYVQ